MALGKYVPQAQIEYDRMKVTDLVGRPLLLKVRELREDFTSPAYPTPKDVVIVDLVDLMGGEKGDGTTPQVMIGCLWGAVAVVDNLRDSAGVDTTLPVMPVSVRGANGRDYVTLTALEGPAQQLAEFWYNRQPNAMDEERARRMAKAKPMGQLPEEAPQAAQSIQGLPPVNGAQAPAAPAEEPGPFSNTPAANTENDVAAALAKLNQLNAS